MDSHWRAPDAAQIRCTCFGGTTLRHQPCQRKPLFLARTEMLGVFAQAVNLQHLWLKGCACHA